MGGDHERQRRDHRDQPAIGDGQAVLLRRSLRLETQGFAVDVAAKKERIIRVDLSYPNDGVNWSDPVAAGWVLVVTGCAGAAIIGLFILMRVRASRARPLDQAHDPTPANAPNSRDAG